MRINASCDEDSAAGKFLGALYYNTRIMEVLTHDERSGFPNDGDEHSLELNLSPNDTEAFLALVVENFGDVRGCGDFVAHVRERMRQPVH